MCSRITRSDATRSRSPLPFPATVKDRLLTQGLARYRARYYFLNRHGGADGRLSANELPFLPTVFSFVTLHNSETLRGCKLSTDRVCSRSTCAMPRNSTPTRTCAHQDSIRRSGATPMRSPTHSIVRSSFGGWLPATPLLEPCRYCPTRFRNKRKYRLRPFLQ